MVAFQIYGLALLCALQLSSAQEAYQQKALNLHNEYRAKHHSPAMELDNNLNDVAVKCAQYYAQKKQIDHQCPYKDSVGENLAGGGGGNWPADQFAEMSTKMWYDEESQYDYNNPDFTPATGHFTQVVWKSSQRLGFGYANIDGYTAAVGLYSPPGNYQGQFPENVLRP